MAASTTYLERYLAGENEQVWAELQELSAAVREEPLYSDALAVARETMRRARYNIELLIPRLSGLGYQFGYEWWPNSDRDLLNDLDAPPVFARPSPEIRKQLATFEAEIGTLPLAVRAWYEYVGCVNFVGMYPTDDPDINEGMANWRQITMYRENHAHQTSDELVSRPCRHDLDPLWVNALDQVYASRYHPSGDTKRNVVEIAPDEFFKYGFPGGGTYEVTLPNTAADPPLEGEWHHTTFVNYLRICFAWGGFPGLECKAQRPERELAFLTRDLLPI